MATEADASGERTVLPPSDMAAMRKLATFLEQQTEPAVWSVRTGRPYRYRLRSTRS